MQPPDNPLRELVSGESKWKRDEKTILAKECNPQIAIPLHSTPQLFQPLPHYGL